MNNLSGFASTPWTWFDIAWPWIGLGAAIVMLFLLFATNTFRYHFQVSKFRDPVWLSWMAIPIYLIHEFEEYGFDIVGVRHAFPNGLCHYLRLANYPDCPIPHEFYLYVNIPLVWIFAVVAALLSYKNSFVGLGLYSVIITNAIAHIVQALVTREYNPGLFTALLVFIPSFLWVSKVCFGKGALSRRGIAVLFGTGIILHTILITSIIAYVNDEISRSMLDLIQFLNASTIILIPWLGDKFLNISAK